MDDQISYIVQTIIKIKRYAFYLYCIYSPIGNHIQVFLSIAVLTIWTLLNFFRVDQVGLLNEIVAVIHALSMLIIVIIMLTMTNHVSSASFVFGKFYNNTGFTSTIYVSTVGLTSALFAFAGYEASAHLAEETGNASIAASKGIIHTIIASLRDMIYHCLYFL